MVTLEWRWGIVSQERWRTVIPLFKRVKVGGILQCCTCTSREEGCIREETLLHMGNGGGGGGVLLPEERMDALERKESLIEMGGLQLYVSSETRLLNNA